MNRKLASVLVSLVFGWLTTAAIAADDTTTPTADTPATTTEPAAATEATTETATTDTSTSDGTIAAAPAETESK